MKRLTEEQKILRQQLYDQGKNDAEIGRALGISKNAVQSWRYTERLASNFRQIQKEKKLKERIIRPEQDMELFRLLLARIVSYRKTINAPSRAIVEGTMRIIHKGLA